MPQLTPDMIPGPAGQLEAIIDVAQEVTSHTPMVIICHPHPQHDGSMHNKVVSTVAKAATACGFSSLRFNYRGVGNSDGEYDQARGEVDDAWSAWQALQQRLDQTGPLYAVGFSFGAYIAAALAQRAQAQDLVCIAPPVSRMPFDQIQDWPASRLLIQGDADEVVDPQQSLAWGKAQNFSCRALPGVGHFFHGQLLELKSIIIEHWTQI